MAIPPTDTAARIVAALEPIGAPVAIGGSGLLAALGLTDDVRDWDVTIDAEPDAVRAALTAAGYGYVDRTSTEPPYATAARLVVDAGDHEVDVVVGFALVDGARATPIPVAVTGHWRGLPIADPATWERAYRLLGRTGKADLLAAYSTR